MSKNDTIWITPQGKKLLEEFYDRFDKAMLYNALDPNRETPPVDNRKFAKSEDGQLIFCDNKTGEMFECTDSYEPGKPIDVKFGRWATGFDV